MKTYAIIVLTLVIACAASAAEQPKLTLAAQGMSAKEFAAEVSKQSGQQVVVDPGLKGTVTLSATNIDVEQALDVACKLNGWTWRKLQFARTSDGNVRLDHLKSAILALASVQMEGLAVRDSSSGATTVFVRTPSAEPDLSLAKLPEGYVWTSVYVMLAPQIAEPVASKPRSIDQPQVTAQKQAGLPDAASQDFIDLARMQPSARRQAYTSQFAAQSNLQPDVRKSMIRDQRAAIRALDPRTRKRVLNDLRSVLNWKKKN